MPSPSQGIVAALQSSLELHWAAVHFYMAVAAHLRRWGYPKLGDRFASDAEEEIGHANKLIARLEYFDQSASNSHAAVAWPRDDFDGILGAQLDLEASAVAAERQGFSAAISVGDGGTAKLFAELLADSEHSVQEIEAAQVVIRQIGLDNYLAAYI